MENMESPPFMDDSMMILYDVPIKTSIYKGFPTATFDYRRVEGLDVECHVQTFSSKVWRRPMPAPVHSSRNHPYQDQVIATSAFSTMGRCQFLCSSYSTRKMAIHKGAL